MDTDTFARFINDHGVDTSMTNYFAPEQYFEALKNPTCLSTSELHYYHSVKTKFKKLYGDKTDDIIKAAIVLTEYCQSFENRINGVIKDRWLSYETFHDILDYLVLVLNRLENRTPMQDKLLETFRAMIPQ